MQKCRIAFRHSIQQSPPTLFSAIIYAGFSAESYAGNENKKIKKNSLDMAKQNEQQNNAQELFTLMTDMALWNFLVQGIKKSHKVSRMQAFANLLDRQRIALLERGDDDNLKGSIQDMTKTWGWDKETIARFLDNLKRLGVLTITTTGNRKAFRLNYEDHVKTHWGTLRASLSHEHRRMRLIPHKLFSMASETPSRARTRMTGLRQRKRNASLGKPRRASENPRRRLRVFRQCRNRGSLIPPYVMNAAEGGAHTKVEQAQWHY